jgi:methylglutaconyl-CoA hydratase
MPQLVTQADPGGIHSIKLNRPEKRNALTRELIQSLLTAVKVVKADSSARVLVLQGEGSVFCAGMDLKEMQERAADPNAKSLWTEDARIYRELLETLFTLPVPVIASINGPALAGGFGLVLTCDFILASEDAFFSLPEPKRGIAAAVVTPFLIHRVGAGIANQWLLSGENISAERARQAGLCYGVAKNDQLETQAELLIKSILTGSPSALATTKKHLINCISADFKKMLDLSMEVSAQARETEDAREGLSAFLEKRKPNWNG